MTHTVIDILADHFNLTVPDSVNTHHGWGKLAWITNKIFKTNFTPLQLKAEVIRGAVKTAD